MLGNLVSSLIWYLKIQGAGIGLINPTTKDSRGFSSPEGKDGNKEGIWFPEQRCIAPQKQLL